MANALDVLQERGFIAQLTHGEELRRLLGSQQVTFYMGYDPTSDSFTTGHLLTLMAHAHMQRAGHRLITLMGTGTGMVGDPSDRQEMRRVMSRETVARNIACFKKQLARFIDYDGGGAGAVMEENSWLLSLNYVDFLREYGVHFNVNRMLSADCYKSRLGGGLTFFEFNYMLMQAYDYLELFRRYGCRLQTGGDDQWSNILAGADLIRKVTGQQAYCMTFKLLTAGDGQKMGKSAGNAVWLDAEKTPPFEFYQHFRNAKDEDVCRLLKLFTFLDMAEIARYGNMRGSELNAGKERLAYEATAIVHGEAEAKKARAAALALFSGGGGGGDIPCTEISAREICGIGAGINIVDLLERCGLTPTRSEARRLIAQGGLKVSGRHIGSHGETIGPDFFEGGTAVIQKGKKTFHQVRLST